MVEDIKSGSHLSFGCGKLRELCKLLPEEEEVPNVICTFYNLVACNVHSDCVLILTVFGSHSLKILIYTIV